MRLLLDFEVHRDKPMQVCPLLLIRPSSRVPPDVYSPAHRNATSSPPTIIAFSPVTPSSVPSMAEEFPCRLPSGGERSLEIPVAMT